MANKKFILSLGSGGVRGFAHLGVYKALFENKIKIDAVYGTSVGSLVGAFIAEGVKPEDIIHLALKSSAFELLDFVFPYNGYIQGLKLNKFLKKHISTAYIEKLQIPLTAVATHAKTGEITYFDSGVLSDCIQASCSIPNVFRPTLIKGSEYLDGDLCSPLPIAKARRDHAQNTVIMAVNIISRVGEVSRVSRSWSHEVSRLAYRQSLIESERALADIYIHPRMSPSLGLDKKTWSERIEIGYQSTQEIMPQLKRILGAD